MARGRFFGIGTNTGMPGLYFASAVRDAGRSHRRDGGQGERRCARIRVARAERSGDGRRRQRRDRDFHRARVEVHGARGRSPRSSSSQIQASRQYAGRKRRDAAATERLDDWAQRRVVRALSRLVASRPRAALSGDVAQRAASGRFDHGACSTSTGAASATTRASRSSRARS